MSEMEQIELNEYTHLFNLNDEREIDNMLRNLWDQAYHTAQVDKKNKLVRREIWRKIAILLERKYKITGSALAVSLIAENIVKGLKRLEIENYRSSVYRALDHPYFQKYKQIRKDNSYIKYDDLDEETKMHIDDAMEAFNTLQRLDFSILPRDIIRDITEESFKTTKKFKQISVAKRVSLIGDYADIDNILELKCRNNYKIKDRIKLMLPDELSKIEAEDPEIAQLLLLNESIYDLVDLLKKRPLENSDDKYKLALSFWCLRQLVRPFTEETWRYDIRQWSMVLKYYMKNDIDAARLISEINEPDFYEKLMNINENVKRKMIKDSISKKQIKNKYEYFIDFFQAFHDSMPALCDLHKYFEDSIQDDRKQKALVIKESLKRSKNQ
jgi:uncharacterized protein YbaR (Trm112 family)